MRFCIYLAEEGLLNERQTLHVIRTLLRETPPLGRIILRERMITLTQLRDLLARQVEDPRPLGRLAVATGYLTEEQVARALTIQQAETPKAVDLIGRMGFLDADVLARAHRAFISVGE